MKKLTKKQWAEHCANNSADSYSVAVNLAILLLWEDEAAEEKAPEREVLYPIQGLTGFQEKYAEKFVSKYSPDWIK